MAYLQKKEINIDEPTYLFAFYYFWTSITPMIVGNLLE